MDINMMNVVYPVLSIGGMGLLLGAGLGYASKIFHVEQDPKIDEVRAALPGANCGGCGFPGCDGCASAIVAGNAPVNACPVGGAACAAAVAAIMGLEAGNSEPTAAFVKCNGTCEHAKNHYRYEGISDCTMAAQLVGGGEKGCSFGCLGLGSCEKACPFDAIHVQTDGIAHVEAAKCTSCGKCVAACPKHIIDILPVNKKVKVQCSSKDKGKDVLANCTVGCIACKICEKNCPFDAIHAVDNLAVIDYTKCKNCGICANKCPKHVLTGAKPQAAPSEAPKKEAPQTAPSDASKKEAPQTAPSDASKKEAPQTAPSEAPKKEEPQTAPSEAPKKEAPQTEEPPAGDSQQKNG